MIGIKFLAVTPYVRQGPREETPQGRGRFFPKTREEGKKGIGQPFKFYHYVNGKRSKGRGTSA